MKEVERNKGLWNLKSNQSMDRESNWSRDLVHILIIHTFKIVRENIFQKYMNINFK